MRKYTDEQVRQAIDSLLLQLIDDWDKRVEDDDDKPEETTAEMLTIKECSEIAKGLFEHTIRQLALQGKIPSVRTGRGKNGKILISRHALIRYLNTGSSD